MSRLSLDRSDAVHVVLILCALAALLHVARTPVPPCPAPAPAAPNTWRALHGARIAGRAPDGRVVLELAPGELVSLPAADVAASRRSVTP